MMYEQHPTAKVVDPQKQLAHEIMEKLTNSGFTASAQNEILKDVKIYLIEHRRAQCEKAEIQTKELFGLLEELKSI